MYIHLPCLQLFYREYPFKGSSANQENPQKRKPIKLQAIHLPYCYVFNYPQRFQIIKFLLHGKLMTYFAPKLPHQVRGKILKGSPEIIAVSKGDEHEKQLSYESNPVLVFPYCSERGLLFSEVYEGLFPVNCFRRR